MNITDNNKELPLGAQELYAHLGVADASVAQPVEPVVATADAVPAAAASIKPIDLKLAQLQKDPEQNAYVVHVSSTGIVALLKKALPYVLVFAIGIGAFVILFTNVSFKTLVHSTTAPATQVAQTAATTVPASQLAAYNAWIQSYFFDVSNPKILAPGYDVSGNGLTNYQKFLLGLNPVRTDTADIGQSDSDALIAGIDPLTGMKETDAQQTEVADAIDLEGLSNKLALQSFDASQPQVLGASITNSQTAAPVDGNADTFTDHSDSYASVNNAGAPINENIPGVLSIPSLKITVPLIWGQTPADVETDLQNGAVHYPGTALPGQIGTAYVSGHSSNYVWAKGSYNKVFATLGNLKTDASFTITATDTQGKQVIFHYAVTSSGIFSPTNQAQFASIGKSTVGISTCWPVGTSSNRLVVYGDLVQIEHGS